MKKRPGCAHLKVTILQQVPQNMHQNSAFVDQVSKKFDSFSPGLVM